MIMSKYDFEDDWDTATKNTEEYKRDKQKWDNEKNKELRDLKTHASLLQNIQDNTDILCKLGAVIIVLLTIIAFQLFYQLLQLERYKWNDMSTLVIIGLIIAGLCGYEYFSNRSIVKCIECGGDVPHFAKACLHCGTRKYRKKIIGMTMYFLTLCFGFPFLYY